jgi:hypothetical protein
MENEEKVQQTLDLIDRDKVLAEDPYFTTRLLARTEKYFSASGTASFIPLFVKLRPYVAVVAIILGIFAGIAAGSRLERIPGKEQASQRTARLQQFAREEYITDITAPVEEEILSTK